MMMYFLGLLLLVVTFCQDSLSSEYGVLNQSKAGKIAVPIKIVPGYVETHRRVDLFPEGKVLDLKDSFIDLFEFPVYQGSPGSGIELTLKANEFDGATALVRLGDAKLFPEFIARHTDFHEVALAPRTGISQILNELKPGLDESWWYTTTGGVVEEANQGAIKVLYKKKSWSMRVGKSFSDLEISQNSWIKYDYVLPQGPTWYTQIVAKVSHPGLTTRKTVIWSPQVFGGGARTSVVNLYELFKNREPNVATGFLEEVAIHIVMVGADFLLEKNIEFKLNSLDVFKSKMGSKTGSSPDIFLVPLNGVEHVNIFDSLESHLGHFDSLKVIKIKHLENSTDSLESISKISLHTVIAEKVPTLFVGEKFILDRLSGHDIAEVLDRQLFLKKTTIWEAGPSDIVFRSVGAKESPALSYNMGVELQPMNKDIENYLKLNYSFESPSSAALRIRLTGIDDKGKAIVQEGAVLSDGSLKIKDFSILKQVDVFFPSSISNLSSNSGPLAFMIQSLQVNSFARTLKYSPITEKNDLELVPERQQVFGVIPGRIQFPVSNIESVHTIRGSDIYRGQAENFQIQYEFATLLNLKLAYYLRVRHLVGDGMDEKLIPLSNKGELFLRNLQVKSFEIVIRVLEAEGLSEAFFNIKKFEVHSFEPQVRLEPIKTGAKTVSTMISYFVPHRPPMSSDIGWLETITSSSSGKRSSGVEEIDSTLSFSEILAGGKVIHLTEKNLDSGDYRLKATSSKSGNSIVIDPDFLNDIAGKQILAKAQPEKIGLFNISKLKIIVIFGLAILILFLMRRVWISWLLRFDQLINSSRIFWLAEFGFAVMTMILFFIKTNLSISLAGIFFVFGFGFAVRYRLRKYLADKWPYFQRLRQSAPYFIGFFAMILFCALNAILKREGSAEFAALLSYYLFILALVIDFFSFSQEQSAFEN